MNTELTPKTPEGRDQFEKVVSAILPYLGNNLADIVLLQVLATLKLKGIVGKELSEEDAKLIKSIQEMIMATPEKREEALIVAQKFLS